MCWDLDLGVSAPGLVSLLSQKERRRPPEPRGAAGPGVGGRGKGRLPSLSIAPCQMGVSNTRSPGRAVHPHLLTRVPLFLSDLTSVTKDFSVPNLAVAVGRGHAVGTANRSQQGQ